MNGLSNVNAKNGYIVINGLSNVNAKKGFSNAKKGFSNAACLSWHSRIRGDYIFVVFMGTSCQKHFNIKLFLH